MNLSDTVAKVFGTPMQGGLYGVEVEVEGVNLPARVLEWASKEDHSLRGESREYTFLRPYSVDIARRALKMLEAALTEPHVAVNNSHRTSVHVHRNMLSSTVLQVYNLISLYYLFELPMTEYAGPSRVGNMYCLRSCDAEFLPIQIVDSINNGDFLERFRMNDNVRYSGLNLTALPQFGSVEFRSFRGTIKATEIAAWLEIIEALYAAAHRYETPLEVSEDFLRHGPEHMLDLVMPEFFAKHVRTFKDWRDTMIVGHQYTFEIAHALEDWKAEYEVPEPQPRVIPGRVNWAAPQPLYDQPIVNNPVDLAAIQQLMNNPPPRPRRRIPDPPLMNAFEYLEAYHPPDEPRIDDDAFDHIDDDEQRWAEVDEIPDEEEDAA